MRSRRVLTPAECGLGGYPTPAGADGIGCGLGCGVWTGGAVWTPARLLAGHDGAYCEWTAGTAGEVTKNTQPVIVDGDMEAAGTAAWTSGRSTLSKESGNPSGVGTQVLRITNDSVVPYARQIAIIENNRYIVSGWSRGDGSAIPFLSLGNAANKAWEGSSSNSWQKINGEKTTTGTSFLMYGDTSTVGQWVEFDDLAFENISITGALPKTATGTLAGSKFVQDTAAAMPWWDDDAFGSGLGGLRFDGTSDYAASDAAASAWALHKEAGFAMSFVVKPDSGVAGTDTIIDTCNATAGNVGVTVEYDTANQQLSVKVANGGGAFELDADTGVNTLLEDEIHYVSISWSQAGGLRVLIDAAAAVTAASGGSASASDASATLQFGRTSGGANFLEGACNLQLIRVGACTDAELARLHADTKAKYNL